MEAFTEQSAPEGTEKELEEPASVPMRSRREGRADPDVSEIVVPGDPGLCAVDDGGLGAGG